ncbi:MAG: hypothetical protein ACRC57_00460 [Sarcina sp.]
MAIMNGNNLGMRPQQKIWMHLLLILLTAGFGNIVYYITIKRKQKQWDSTVQGLNNHTNTNHNYNH